MVMVSSVAIIAFSVVYVTTYLRTQQENRDKLLFPMPSQQVSIAEGPIRLDSAFQMALGSGETIVSGYARSIAPDAGISFSLALDPQNNVIEVFSMVDLHQESYAIMAAKAVASSVRDDTMTIEGRTWQYLVTPVKSIHREISGGNVILSEVTTEITHIRFLDVTDSYRMLRSLALTLSASILAVLAVFFFISRFFADRAIKPMKEAWEKQSRFITDASHELKTPLSVISANCGVLYADKEDTVESQLKWVDSIMRAGDRMAGLVNSMLSLVSMEDSQLELRSSQFSLSAEANAAVSDMEAAALEKNLVLTKTIEPDVTVESDKEHVRRILSILLDNAVKYTDNDGEISVSLKKEKRRAVFTIRNSGDGIPPEHLPRLFDRFYRADSSRSSENSGYGLGLAIANAIAGQLDAELSVDSVVGEYTQFSLTLS